MASGSIILFVFAAVFTFAEIKAQTCREGWTYFGGSCYGYGSTAVSWTEAATFCSLLNARLAEIGSAEENEFVVSLVSNTTGSTRVWLGGTDIFNEGNWVWVSTREHIFPYHNWHQGQPSDSNNAGEDCAAMTSSFQYQWDDLDCGRESNFLCEQQYTGSV